MRGSFCAYAQAGLLFAGKLTDVGDAGENGLEAVEQLKAIIAELLVLVHDHDLIEEAVDGRAQGGEGGKCGRVVLGSKGSIDPLRYKKAAKAHDALDSELGFLRLRYKPVQANTSELIEVPLQRSAIKPFASAGNEFRFATAVAGYGQLLRGGKYTGNWSYADARQLAAGSLGKDNFGYRGEFLRMIDLTQALATKENK